MRPALKFPRHFYHNALHSCQALWPDNSCRIKITSSVFAAVLSRFNTDIIDAGYNVTRRDHWFDTFKFVAARSARRVR
jgi:hypothetical protein